MELANAKNKYFARLKGSSYAFVVIAESREQALKIAASKLEVSTNSSYIILSTTPAKDICYFEN